MLIQDNPVLETDEPKLSIDHAGRCYLRWTEHRADGKFVDCEAQIQLIGARIVRVRRPEQGRPGE